MKVAVVGHSLIAIRQRWFFEEMAGLGHEVLLVGPGMWGPLRVKDYTSRIHFVSNGPTSFRYHSCRHMGENIYDYRLLGAQEAVESFNPDWLYVQAEPGSFTAHNAVQWKARKRALFTWENITLRGDPDRLAAYDLVICGNSDAQDLVRLYNAQTVIAPQVGIDTRHFSKRSEEKHVRVAFVGRPVPEKGIDILTLAWPTAQVLEWTPYEHLPNCYSDARLIVCFSQDTPRWREQAMPYVSIESLACETPVILSDAGAIPFWMTGCPGATILPAKSNLLELRNAISGALENLETLAARGAAGRQWVVERFDNKIVAQKLVEAFHARE